MHICMLSSYIPQQCGIASYTHYLAETLSDSYQNLAMTILTERSSTPQSTENFRVLRAFNSEQDYSDELATHIKDISPDIIHIQHEYGIFGIDDRFHNLLVQLRELRAPVVVTLHTVHTRLSVNSGCTRPHMRRLLKKVDIEKYQRQIGELADMVVVHQETPIRKVLLRQGLSPERVITIPHGTRIMSPPDMNEAKTAMGFDPINPLIVAFGYFEISKNILLLIEAFRRVKTRVPNAKLWLGGYIRFPEMRIQAYRNQCLKLIEKYQLKDDIVFSEQVTPEAQVPYILGAADTVCFVYREDTRSSSGALHLAMGLGKAVVASRIPKFHELTEVADEVMVCPRSARELYWILSRMLLDETFRRSIEERVQSYANQTAWPNIALNHKAIYDQVTKKMI